MPELEQYKPYRPSDKYFDTDARLTKSRHGIVDAFNTAFAPKDSSQGAHWNHRQYRETGVDLAARLKEVTQRDKMQITQMVLEHSAKTKPGEPISILDFGAGNGRLSGLYEKLGDVLLQRDKKLEVVALDTSREALNQFAIRLKQAGFETSSDRSTQARDIHGSEEKGYLYDEFSKGNVKIKLVHSNVDNDANAVKNLVLKNNNNKNIGITLGFDSLPFIEDTENRAEFLKMFREITDKDILFTVPGVNAEKWQPLRYEFEKRRASQDPDAVGFAKEDESLVYNFQGNHLFYQLFDRAKLAMEATKAGLEDFSIRINQFWHPERHDKNEGLQREDLQRTNQENMKVKQQGHTAAMDQVFRTVDGFIQLHHNSNK